MAGIRLNARSREALVNFATQNVACEPEQAERDRAYTEAARLVARDVERRFPRNEMQILEKYETASQDFCINGGSPSGMFLRFDFDRSDDSAPLVPRRYCSTRSISFGQDTTSAIEALEKADTKLTKARSEKIGNYRALIFSARTYEEVLEVWPAAAALSDRIGAPSTAIVALSSEVIERIRADNAGAPVAAAA